MEQTETETKRRGKSTGDKLSPVENDSAGWKKANDRCCQHRATASNYPVDSIKDIFADVPVQDYIDSIWNDIAEAEEEITDNPMYIILNLARVLAYIKDGLVLSKKEGGEWALNNVHERYHSLIQDALIEYAEDRNISYDADHAKDYAIYMVNQIASLRERIMQM